MGGKIEVFNPILKTQHSTQYFWGVYGNICEKASFTNKWRVESREMEKQSDKIAYGERKRCLTL